MIPRSRLTLRRKLIIWFAALVAIMVVVFGAMLYGATRWALIRVIDASLSDTVDRTIANASAFPVPQFSTADELVVRLPDLGAFEGNDVMMQAWHLSSSGYQLAGSTANIVDYVDPLDQAALDYEMALYTQGGEPKEVWSDTLLSGGAWRVVSRPVSIWGQDYVIQAAMSLTQVNEASRWLLVIIGLAMAMALLGTSAMGWGMATRALGRIDVITRAAASIARTDDLRTRLPDSGESDEIGRLTSVFNRMMDRIEQMFGTQQRFVADVSHELRTPLTAIRGHLDLIKRYGADPESIEALDSEVNRMNRLVSDLLLLAKADYGGLKVERVTVDLDDLLTEIYRDAKLLAKDRNLKVTVRDYEPVRVSADPDRMKQLLLNLVSNAIKFTPDGGTVTLNLRRTQHDAIIEVIDTGIGIREEDQRHIFDRFFQADQSRARGTGSEGLGLGLSIAKWIADQHGAVITVESEPGVGTTFRVTMPHLDAVSTLSDAVTRPRISLIRRDRTGERTAVK